MLFGLTVVAAVVTILVQQVLDGCQAAVQPYRSILNFVVTLSSGFVSDAIFYFIVNYCAFKKRQATLRLFMRNRLERIVELLRQCKSSVRNPFDFSQKGFRELSRAEYVELFKSANLHKKYWLSENETLLQYFDRRRVELDSMIGDLNSCKEYLAGEEFKFVMDVANSVFLFKGIIPNDEDKADYQNQDYIGTELYDLYEEGMALVREY